MKTAVEWLGEKILELGNSYELPEDDIDELIIKAKEMDKEQMIEFACQVAETSAMKYIQGKTTRMIAEELIKQQEQ